MPPSKSLGKPIPRKNKQPRNKYWSQILLKFIVREKENKEQYITTDNKSIPEKQTYNKKYKTVIYYFKVIKHTLRNWNKMWKSNLN